MAKDNELYPILGIGEKLSVMQLRLLQIWQKGRLRQMNLWDFFWKNIRSGSILISYNNQRGTDSHS